MNILFWNYRGLGNPGVVQALQELITMEDPKVVFLSEIKLRNPRANVLRIRLGYQCDLTVDCD